MPIMNFTTSVPVDRSVGEIQKALARAGADSVSVEYREGTVTAVRFVLKMNGSPVAFRMPCNVAGVLEALRRAKQPRSRLNPEHAARVAWRIVKDWTLVQLALVEARQAQLAEVFLAYAVTASGETAYQLFEKSAGKLLAAGDPDGNL